MSSATAATASLTAISMGSSSTTAAASAGTTSASSDAGMACSAPSLGWKKCAVAIGVTVLTFQGLLG